MKNTNYRRALAVMADPERTRRAIGTLTFALARISTDNNADALDAARSLLDMRLNDLPTKELRRRFQSTRDRVIPQGAKPLVEGFALIPNDADWLRSEIRELLIELLLHQKLSASHLQGICPLCLKELRSEVLASHVDRWKHAEWPDLWHVEILRILRCLACGQIYSQ